MTRTVLAGLLFSSLLSAQLAPPPVNPTIQSVAFVGQRLEQVGGLGAGHQQIEAYCATAAARPTSEPTVDGVGLGNAVYWLASCGHPSGGYYASGTPGALAFFAVSPYFDNPNETMPPPALLLPGAAATFDRVFLIPGATIIVAPQYRYTFAGIDAWVIELPVPPVPALIGTKWASQSFRIDPTNGRPYLSDAIAVEVRP